MGLKPGHVLTDFAGSMAAAMENALKEEWQVVKGVPLPEAGQEDRRLLLVAIARGLLRYLEENQDSLIALIRLRRTTSTFEGDYAVPHLDLNIDL
jgi:hypothetical protein